MDTVPWVARCKSCDAAAPNTLVSFSMNMGLLVTRHEEHITGPLCRPCVHRYFWRYAVVNLFGWLGLVSMFVAPLYLFQNIVEYVRVLTKRHPPSEGAPVVR